MSTIIETKPNFSNSSATKFWRAGVVVLCLVGLTFFSGCVSRGHTFSYPAAANLELRQLALSEYRSVFRESPNAVSQQINANGKYDIVQYRYVHATLVTIKTRALFLEFKDGKLNAYVHASNFESETTLAPMNKINQLKRGESTKAEVFKLLGKPNGKALCPSTLADFKDKCDGNSEIWTWQSIGSQPNNGTRTKRPSAIRLFVTFNQTGLVKEIETESFLEP